jgi:hypothetical protein
MFWSGEKSLDPTGIETAKPPNRQTDYISYQMLIHNWVINFLTVAYRYF